MLHHDVDKGWVTSDGDPRWQSTEAALDRVTGERIKWFSQPRKAHVAHLENGKPVATIRRVAAHRKWLVRIEGFQFWHFNRVMGREMFDPVESFDNIAAAKKFVRTILRQAGALA